MQQAAACPHLFTSARKARGTGKQGLWRGGNGVHGAADGSCPVCDDVFPCIGAAGGTRPWWPGPREEWGWLRGSGAGRRG
eukprot:969300-Prorocentrum_lima.AAC.1